MGGYLESLKGIKREKSARFVATARRLIGRLNQLNPGFGRR